MSKQADKIPKRAKLGELAKLLNKSENAVRRYIRARELKPDRSKTYLVAPLMEEMQERIKRDSRNVDPNAELEKPITWADQLKSKQVEKLQVQIDQLRDRLMPIDEVKSLLAEHAAGVKGALNNWVQYIAAEKRDPEILEWAELARDRALNLIEDEM
ncbi:MAG: hypothetical protein GY833_24015 [Aestuariibacter sp.]|nr:hypothetical protein [Aestuariibacter sp.]